MEPIDQTTRRPTPPAPPPPPLPGVDGLKAQARRLRLALADEGDFISHGEALELVARQYGYRDWNTIRAAAASKRPAEPFALGATVTGRYLGQAFTAKLIGLSRLDGGRRYRVTLDLDEAVDVVRFDSFSAWRKQVRGVIGRDGRSAARTSDGQPHLVLQTEAA